MSESNISNTRDSVSSGYPNIEQREQRSIFDEIRGVWIADETLCRVLIYLLNRDKN